MYIDLEPLIKQLEDSIEVGKSPTLAILHFGEKTDSRAYIKSIEKKALHLGVKVIIQDLEEAYITKAKIAELVDLANAILPVRPFPRITEEIIKNRLYSYKDVDNFTGKGFFNNCTGEAVLNILNFLNIKPQARVVVVGRHIGLDIALTLLKANYSPTIVHSKTLNAEDYIKEADVVISCTGVKDLIKKDMVKPGATVIDVGLGDVDKGVAEIADITTIRDGVGAVTTAVLYKHIFKCVTEEEK